MYLSRQKIHEIRAQRAMPFLGRALPGDAQESGVQGLAWQNQLLAQGIGPSVIDEAQKARFVVTVNFIADNRKAEVREMDADLVRASGDR